MIVLKAVSSFLVGETESDEVKALQSTCSCKRGGLWLSVMTKERLTEERDTFVLCN